MKVICPSCGEVCEIENTSLEKIYCKSCGINYSVNEGVKALDRTFALYKNKAYKEFLNMNFEDSNGFYEAALELKENDLTCVTKYAMNMVYGQTFDRIMFNEAVKFIDTKDIVLDTQNTYIFLSFIRSFIGQIKEFISASERLKKDNIFLNLDYYNYYIEGIKSAKASLVYLKDVFPLLKEEDYKKYLEDNENVESLVDLTMNNLNSLMVKVYNVSEVGDVNYEEEHVNFSKDNVTRLDEESIEDLRIIIPNMKFKFYNKILYIGGGSLAVISLILLIVGSVTKNSIISYISFIPIGLLVALTLTMFLLIRKENKKEDKKEEE